MYKNKTFLAIIPARGGSKRLPRKNTLLLAGKPLISWSIEAALKSRYIDSIIVTSDDEEILDIAIKEGALIVKRPPNLADDNSTTFDAVEHTIFNSKLYDYIVLLQPTSPLREAKHIDEAIELLSSKDADAIISVSLMEHSPLWSNTLKEDGSMVNFISNELRRSQDLEPYYRLNGAIYICNTAKLLEERTFFLKDNIYSYIMAKDVSIDIDEKLDFSVANLIINEKVNNARN